MPLDPGQRKADASFDEIKARLTKVYEAAARDIIARLDDHQRRLIVEDAKRRRLVKAGKLSETAYQDWLRSTVYRGKNWETQVKDLTDTLLDANRQALRIIEGQRLEVFEENANFMAYALERGAGMDLSFTLYDRSAVTRLIRNQPALLPTKDMDARKDAAWNRKTIANEVARGILSGASIPEISQNMAAALGRNNDGSMARYARTAMTGAQNAGRIERMQEAREMGIKVKKKWLATLDSRTRDSHAAMDGETRDIDEKFSNGLLYPGDPKGDPAETWNCRCTLINEYEEYPSKGGTRYDQESDEYVEKMTYSEWKEAKNNKFLKKAPTSATMNQESQSSAIPYGYDGDFSDYEPLSLSDYGLELLDKVHQKALETGFEYGVVIADGHETPMFTSNRYAAVEVPNEYLHGKHVALYHSHTNATCLSGKDFEWLTRGNVDSVSVKAINGDVYSVSIGDGYKPSYDEFVKAVVEIRAEANKTTMQNPNFLEWTEEQRSYMAIKEQAYLIARRFGWTLEGERK